LLLIRGILTAFRQTIHLATCPNLPSHLSVGLAGVCRRTGGDLDRLGMARGCWAVELQQEAYSGGLLAPGVVPQAEVADLVQALGQDMLQEPAHELGSMQSCGVLA